MTLLIATDEAGYGPKLGPLVIVATAWSCDLSIAQSPDNRLSTPLRSPGGLVLVVDDSKRLFTRQAAGANPRLKLDRITAAAARWAKLPSPDADYPQWFRAIAPDDVVGIQQQPWFAGLDRWGKATPGDQGCDPEAIKGCDPEAITTALLNHWQQDADLTLIGMSARVIDAARYNRWLVEEGINKADLLSRLTCESALGLADRFHEVAGNEPIEIFSDRHGGRARYAGLLQHHAPDHLVRVVAESSSQSEYFLERTGPGPDAADGNRLGAIRWRFTVGGDSFPPVSLASIIAKSTRERLMDRFNDYFASAWGEFVTDDTRPPLPTAGYAADATRFLRETVSLRRALGVADERLVRIK
jgi:ribonuclease HII